MVSIVDLFNFRDNYNYTNRISVGVVDDGLTSMSGTPDNRAMMVDANSMLFGAYDLPDYSYKEVPSSEMSATTIELADYRDGVLRLMYTRPVSATNTFLYIYHMQ